MGLGPRTPALIISPGPRAGDNPAGGSIDSTVYEFSSVSAVHRGPPRAQAADRSRCPGVAARRRLRFLSATTTRHPEPPRAHLSLLVNRRFVAVALLTVAPLMIAAADPQGDAVGCTGITGGGHPPEFSSARSAGSVKRAPPPSGGCPSPARSRSPTPRNRRSGWTSCNDPSTRRSPSTTTGTSTGSFGSTRRRRTRRSRSCSCPKVDRRRSTRRS